MLPSMLTMPGPGNVRAERSEKKDWVVPPETASPANGCTANGPVTSDGSRVLAWMAGDASAAEMQTSQNVVDGVLIAGLLCLRVGLSFCHSRAKGRVRFRKPPGPVVAFSRETRRILILQAPFIFGLVDPIWPAFLVHGPLTIGPASGHWSNVDLA